MFSLYREIIAALMCSATDTFDLISRISDSNFAESLSSIPHASQKYLFNFVPRTCRDGEVTSSIISGECKSLNDDPSERASLLEQRTKSVKSGDPWAAKWSQAKEKGLARSAGSELWRRWRKGSAIPGITASGKSFKLCRERGGRLVDYKHTGNFWWDQSAG